MSSRVKNKLHRSAAATLTNQETGTNDSKDRDIEALSHQEVPLKGSASGSNSHSAFLAKAVLRRVCDLLSHDEDEITQLRGVNLVIALLKDILIGIIFGVFTISILIFLDHRNVIHFQSAHTFRNAALQLVTNPDTLANLQESSNLKFLTVTDYELKRKEIDIAEEKITNANEILQTRNKDSEEKQKELDSIKPEYESLYNNPLLHLNKFCEGCVWGGGGMTCNQREQYLKDTYNTKPIAAKMNAMEHPSCISK